MFGCNVFGWTAPEAESFRLLDAFIDAGFNFLDTADVYSIWVPGHHGGESESIIGRWLQSTGKRDQVVLATKVGFDMHDGKKGLARNYILQAVEDSLTRLQTDHIDLYQSHTDDATVPPRRDPRSLRPAHPAGQSPQHRRLQLFRRPSPRSPRRRPQPRPPRLPDPPT